VEPRSMMTSPSGTGSELGCHVVIWVGSSSSTLRRRRRVALRWDPLGPPVPRLGGPPRPGAPGAPVVGAPGREPGNPPPAPPGRDVGPPGREGGPPGRALIGRGPPGPVGRPVEPPGIGRRAPGGGGIGRPVELSGRPGGGGIGRPVWLSGGRVEGVPPSDSPATERCVGRMVVGPSGEALRVGAGFTIGARLRTTLGAGSATGAGAGATASTLWASAKGDGDWTTLSAGFVTRLTRAGAGASVLSLGAAAFVALGAFVALAAFAALAASSGWTSRRRPSASARRRMRSAWASSIDAEGLDAPMPSVWASVSSSLLVSPSSFESSCTRIFFWAKTFPCFSCRRFRGHSYLFFHNHRQVRPRLPSNA
jgi:hypothetical protein